MQLPRHGADGKARYAGVVAWRDLREYLESIAIAAVVGSIGLALPEPWRPPYIAALVVFVAILGVVIFRGRRG